MGSLLWAVRLAPAGASQPTGAALTCDQAMNVDVSTSREDVARHRDGIAGLLLDFTPSQHSAWPSREAALAAVDESLQEDKRRISAVAVADGAAVGWIAGFETYSRGFELHPIVVKHDCQRKGVGRSLLEAFEAAARRLGALTVYLGADDHVCSTSLGGVDLFPGVLAHAQEIRNLSQHPYEFYQRCGYEIVGVLPDVNGKGQPDIWLANSVAE